VIFPLTTIKNAGPRELDDRVISRSLLSPSPSKSRHRHRFCVLQRQTWRRDHRFEFTEKCVELSNPGSCCVTMGCLQMEIQSNGTIKGPVLQHCRPHWQFGAQSQEALPLLRQKLRCSARKRMESSWQALTSKIATRYSSFQHSGCLNKRANMLLVVLFFMCPEWKVANVIL